MAMQNPPMTLFGIFNVSICPVASTHGGYHAKRSVHVRIIMVKRPALYGNLSLAFETDKFNAG